MSTQTWAESIWRKALARSASSDSCPKDKRGEYGYAAWSADDKAEKAKKKEMRRQWKEDVRRDRRYEFVTTKRRY